MSEHHHIQRHDGTPPPQGNGACHWAVRWYDGLGKRRVRTFADRKLGGTAAALQAAIAFRDAALAEAEAVRSERIAAHYIPALTPLQRRKLRARMVDYDQHAYNRHFRVRISVGEPAPRQICFPVRDYGNSLTRAFRAALRFRDRIERLPVAQRKEALA